MSFVRKHAATFATSALLWHLVTIALVPTVLACEPVPGTAMNHEPGMMDHAGMTGHEGMVDCPMQKKRAPACPKHGDGHNSHDCDCPTIGCTPGDPGFMAVFGGAGVLPTTTTAAAPLQTGDAQLFVALFQNRLALPPLSPPPRA